MNKAAGAGIAIVIIAVIIGVAYSVYSPDANEGNVSVDGTEIIDKESDHTDYSVELTEKMGLKTP